MTGSQPGDAAGVVGEIGRPRLEPSPVTTRRGQRQRRAGKPKQPNGQLMAPAKELPLELTALLQEWRPTAGDGGPLPADDNYLVTSAFVSRVVTPAGDALVILEIVLPRFHGPSTLRIRIVPAERGARESVYSIDFGDAIAQLVAAYFATRECVRPLRPDPA